MAAPANSLVHLELLTGNLRRACAFYTRMFGWRAETVDLASSSYLRLELGNGIDGGVVECDSERSLWLPYVEVDEVAGASERACALGATLALAPREGPAGWRSVLTAPDGSQIALWQSKA